MANKTDSTTAPQPAPAAPPAAWPPIFAPPRAPPAAAAVLGRPAPGLAAVAALVPLPPVAPPPAPQTSVGRMRHRSPPLTGEHLFVASPRAPPAEAAIGSPVRISGAKPPPPPLPPAPLGDVVAAASATPRAAARTITPAPAPDVRDALPPTSAAFTLAADAARGGAAPDRCPDSCGCGRSPCFETLPNTWAGLCAKDWLEPTTLLTLAVSPSVLRFGVLTRLVAGPAPAITDCASGRLFASPREWMRTALADAGPEFDLAASLNADRAAQSASSHYARVSVAGLGTLRELARHMREQRFAGRPGDWADYATIRWDLGHQTPRADMARLHTERLAAATSAVVAAIADLEARLAGLRALLPAPAPDTDPLTLPSLQ